MSRCQDIGNEHSPIAQWQSIRLLIEGLLVRVQLGEQVTRSEDFLPGVFALMAQCVHLVSINLL